MAYCKATTVLLNQMSRLICFLRRLKVEWVHWGSSPYTRLWPFSVGVNLAVNLGKLSGETRLFRPLTYQMIERKSMTMCSNSKQA